MEKYKYKISIEVTAEHINKQNRQMGGVTLDARLGGDPLMIGRHGMTSLGFQAVVTTLVESISSMAKVYAQQGGNQGEVYADAIRRLESNLMDVGREQPVSRVNKKSKN